MIVVDASAALSALMNAGAARDAIAAEDLHAPHLIDVEIANALRRQLASGALGVPQARRTIQVWKAIGVSRYTSVGMLDRIWALRENLSAYDASYIALAEALGCELLTADGRLSRAPGVRCPVATVPA
jgi:predicted nucleic acid-binding protein